VDGGLTPAQVYAKNAGSVVAISCKATETEYGQIFETKSSGSGFILTKSGYIASNYHVVSGADSITVTISDGKEYAAQYIGGDESNDIALLKVEATDLQPVTIGSSDALIVGDQVAAIGNPLGELTSTLTVGYISAKDRVITTDGTQINMLQTDAAINSGNSGGPLFNMKGEVIGITTAKYSGTTNSGASIEGIGFAIPIDDVIGMLEDLRDHGYVKGAYLGVSVSNVDAVISQTYGLPMGVLVHDVVIGGAAQKGGVKSQDIIVNLGGYDIENMNDLTRALRNFEAGQTVTITVYRNGGNVQLSLTLDEKPRTER
jgi:serine protease Do